MMVLQPGQYVPSSVKHKSNYHSLEETKKEVEFCSSLAASIARAIIPEESAEETSCKQLHEALRTMLGREDLGLMTPYHFAAAKELLEEIKTQ